jgi:hypothetical protein
MNKLCAIAVGLTATLLMTTGCQEQMGKPRTPRKEAVEYDCRKHDPDRVCQVPWKDKIVLYCYKGVIPKVVRYREECK